MLKKKLIASSAVLFLAVCSNASVFEKSPDLGTFWNPLGGPSGTYVYADSFRLLSGDNRVTGIGTWLNNQSGLPGSLVSLQIWGDAGGPNAANVLCQTAKFNTPTSGLNLYSLPTTTTPVLAYNTTYWFAAKVEAADVNGSYFVGGHTQNSQQADNGTFWYSNDPNGIVFDGQNLTPEMAFQVTLAPVPEPASMAALGLGVLALIRKRAKK